MSGLSITTGSFASNFLWFWREEFWTNKLVRNWHADFNYSNWNVRNVEIEQINLWCSITVQYRIWAEQKFVGCYHSLTLQGFKHYCRLSNFKCWYHQLISEKASGKKGKWVDPQTSGTRCWTLNVKTINSSRLLSAPQRLTLTWWPIWNYIKLCFSVSIFIIFCQGHV